MPTLLEAAGVTFPNDHPFDGRSILPLLKGERVDWPDRSLVLQPPRQRADTVASHSRSRATLEARSPYRIPSRQNA